MPDESSLQLDDDVRLMVKARDGDRSAYEMVYRRYFRIVVSFLAHHTGPTQVCEDLAQEVFARVWERRGRYRPGMSVLPYLLGFAKKVHREHQARACREVPIKHRRPRPAVEGTNVGPEAAARRKDQGERLRSYLARLPPKQREALELVYLAQMTVAEAANVMNCSTEALWRNLSDARRRLQTTFFLAGEELEFS